MEKLKARIKELERLVDIISRGKMMWQSTFDAIQDPVVIISSDFVIQRANLATAALARVNIKELIGKKCYRMYAGGTNMCEGCPLTKVFDNNAPGNGSIQIKNRSFEAYAYPYPGGDAASEAIVVHYRDVTEARRLQQELVQQEKMAAIGMLAGGVAHEINNPLGGILAFTQLLMRDVSGQDRLKSDLKEIESAAQRCKKIVQDLLDFSRISSGRDKKELDVSALLERVIPFIKMELKSLNVELKTEIDPKLPLVYGDGNRLEQVFLNLMTNAIHAMPKGGALTIKASRQEKFVEINVIDTGVGIPKENIARVFDPFFTTKQPGKGTGLGLSITYRIVRDHGGTIDVESSPGKGSVFTVRLPIYEANHPDR